MGHNNYEIAERDTSKECFLLKNKFHIAVKFFIEIRDLNRRNTNGGFISIEMLIWISIILTIFVGYFSIHKVYKTEHQKINEEFIYEWNHLNASR